MQGTVISLECSIVPCSHTSLDLLDRLRDAEELILRHDSWNVMKCFEPDVDGFPIHDKFRELLLAEDSPNAELLTSKERSEFLWRLLGHLALGGATNQFEDDLSEYRTALRTLYKDLVSCAITRQPNGIHACKKSLEKYQDI